MMKCSHRELLKARQPCFDLTNNMLRGSDRCEENFSGLFNV